MTVAPPRNDSAASYFEFLRATNPPALRIWMASDESTFCKAVEEAIETNIRKIEAGARRYCTLCEIGLSQLMTDLLSCGGVPAVSEGNHNGHVDILISHPSDKLAKLLCECKKYNGYEVHCDGCNQLLKRYHSGRASRAYCIEFFPTRDMYGKLTKLRRDFDNKTPHEQEEPGRDHWIKGSFVTVHLHFTGTTVEIVHIGCNVYHPDAKK